MNTNKYEPIFSNVRTYQIIMPSGYSCFIGADSYDIDDKEILALKINGVVIAAFNLKNIAGFRIV